MVIVQPPSASGSSRSRMSASPSGQIRPRSMQLPARVARRHRRGVVDQRGPGADGVVQHGAHRRATPRRPRASATRRPPTTGTATRPRAPARPLRRRPLSPVAPQSRGQGRAAPPPVHTLWSPCTRPGMCTATIGCAPSGPALTPAPARTDDQSCSPACSSPTAARSPSGSPGPPPIWACPPWRCTPPTTPARRTWPRPTAAVRAARQRGGRLPRRRRRAAGRRGGRRATPCTPATAS